MDDLTRIAYDRLGVVAVTPGPTSPGTAVAAAVELARVGVRITNPEAITDSLAPLVPDLVRHERHRRGQRSTYSPLFAGFPEKLPQYDHGPMRFMFAIARLGGTVAYSAKELRAALDFTDIDWWPASSVPSDVDQALLDRAEQEVLPGDRHIEWATITLVDADRRDPMLRDWLASSLGSASSLREDVRSDVETLARRFGVAHIDPDTVRFRENRVLLFQLAWETDRARLPSMGATPDDLLRLFAALTGGDVSLAGRVRFPKLTRPQRRDIVAALEASPRLDDVFRRRGLWLAVDRGLHLGEHPAPRTREVFARLRSTRHNALSFPSRFERCIADGDIAGAAKLAGVEAPGALGRSLRRLLALAGDVHEFEAVLTAVALNAERVGLKVLLAARAQIADNGATYPRVAVTKAGGALTIARPPGHLALVETRRTAALTGLGGALTAAAAAKGPWVGETVYIAPGLDGLLVPDALRHTAQGVVQVERGSRLPLGDAPVLRMFVHWREQPGGPTSDLDLSMLALDESYNTASFVSWTNLADGTMTHSGDIVSAPDGAEEFIDVPLDRAAANRGWRYLVPAVLRYSGPMFDDLAEATAGWMLREDATSDRATCDPATVVNAFELTGRRRYAVPFLIDLATREVLYVDLYLQGAPQAHVERDGTTMAALVAAIADRAALKTSVAHLAALHAYSRGARVVEDRAEASIVFACDDEATYNPLRPERLLADLL
jgi:hypothetical protein